jgi:KDO2-lipid IV(A) lauroyltransferase
MMTISHGLEYFAVYTLTKLAQILPGRVADWLAVALGNLAYLILTSRREIALNNLRRAFGSEKSEKEFKAIARKVFVNISRTLIEFARQPVLAKEKILSMIDAEGIEYLEQVKNNGKGAMLVAGHFGNWELLAGWVAANGYPLDLLVGQQHNKKVDDLMISFRRALGVGIIPIGIASRHVIKSLRSNRMVAAVNDQHSATGSVVVNFFGRKAASHKGPAAFAVKMDCPLMTGALIRKGYNRHYAVILPPIYPPKTGDEEKDIYVMTQKFTDCLEQFVRQYPEQWMWTHRRWKLD